MLKMLLPIQFFRLRQTSYPRAKASSGRWQKRPESLTTFSAIQGKMVSTKNRNWTNWVSNCNNAKNCLITAMPNNKSSARHENPRTWGEERAIYQTGIQADVGLHLRHGDGGDLAEALSRQ